MNWLTWPIYHQVIYLFSQLIHNGLRTWLMKGFFVDTKWITNWLVDDPLEKGLCTFIRLLFCISNHTKCNQSLCFVLFPVFPSCRHRYKRLLQELPNGRLHPPPISSNLPANQLPPQGQALPAASRRPRTSCHHHQRLPDAQAQDLQNQHAPAHLQLGLQSVGPEQEPRPAPDGNPHGHQRASAAAPPHPAAAPPDAAPAEQSAPGLLQQEAVQHRDVARALLAAAGLRPLAAHAPQAQGTGHQQQDGGDGVSEQRNGVEGKRSDILYIHSYHVV